MTHFQLPCHLNGIHKINYILIPCSNKINSKILSIFKEKEERERRIKQKEEEIKRMQEKIRLEEQKRKR